MIREQLHKDIDRLSPSPELLDKISLMMKEEAEKPKLRLSPRIYRFAGVAAGICLIGFAAMNLGLGGSGNGGSGNGDITVNEAELVTAQSYMEETIAETTAEAAEYSDGAVCDEAEAACEEAPMSGEESGGGISNSSVTSGFGAAFEKSNSAEAASVDSEPYSALLIPEAETGGKYFKDIIGEEEYRSWLGTKSESGLVTDIEEAANLFSFIKEFGIDDETAEKRLSGVFSEDETAIILSGDKDSFSEAFVSGSAVYCNGKIYTPEWFDSHTEEQYGAEGISPEKIAEKLDMIISAVPQENRASLSERLSGYIG